MDGQRLGMWPLSLRLLFVGYRSQCKLDWQLGPVSTQEEKSYQARCIGVVAEHPWRGAG